MHTFYDSNIAKEATTHQLSEDESKHAIRVLRLTTGDLISIVDGKGSKYTCVILSAEKKSCTVKVEKVDTQEKDLKNIHIAVGPTKQMERIEWFVEKATEIGVNEISLIRCKNAERTKIKLDRLHRKAVSAMKQSGRFFLPVINEIISFDSFVSNNPNGLIAFCGNGTKGSIDIDYKNQKCPILIGPEGDFTEEEVKQAVSNGYKLITLGENRLRTETAALYACMLAKTLK